MVLDAGGPNLFLPLRRHRSKIGKAGWLDNALMVMGVMLAAPHHFEVFWSVVVLDAVLVVNNFATFNLAAQGL